MFKEERWQKQLPGLIDRLFTPRIAEVLKSHPGVDKHQNSVAFLPEARGYYIWGKPGTGKTIYAGQLTMAIIKYRMQNKLGMPDVMFTTSIDLLDRIRKSYNNHEERIMDHAISVPILILDDLGTEKISDWAMEMLNHLINQRYEHLQMTIITSNYELTTLGKKLDSRLVSRIYEMCKIIKLDGGNLRLNK